MLAPAGALVDIERNIIPKNDNAIINHIFSNKKNKFKNTPENIDLLESVANNSENLKYLDDFGKKFYAKIDPTTGKEIYVYVRKGVIKGAGYNDIPRFIKICE